MHIYIYIYILHFTYTYHKHIIYHYLGAARDVFARTLYIYIYIHATLSPLVW